MLVGREEEAAKLKNKIEKGLKSDSPLSIYISGAPGTGKTETTKTVLKSLDKNKKVQYIYVNCVEKSKKIEVERAILTKLDALPSKGALYESALYTAFEKSKKKIIIVLDEIDHLESRRNTFLYSAFEWPMKSNGHVIVIGIANALDLTTRLLPNLVLKPEVFSFQPYKSEQIVNILKNELTTKTSGNEKAILLCAKKVAAQTGDIRVALNIANTAFKEMDDEDNEEEENKSFAAQPMGLSTPKKNTIQAVNRIFKDVQASPLIRSNLPEHSKIFLATLVRLVGNTKTKTTTKQKLIAAYEKVCKNLKVTAVNGDERIRAIDNLETMSVIKCNGTHMQAKITFIDEIEQARSKIADSNLVATVDEMDL